MKEINFKDQRDLILWLGKELFEKITSLSKDIRPDEKERTGIRIIARQLRTRNLIMVSIYSPSEAAEFFAVEKSVRTETMNDPTSQVTQYPDDMQFAGCISYFIDPETEYHVSCSGLTAQEDTVISLIIMAMILNEPVSTVIDNIKSCGLNQQRLLDLKELLPKEFFEEEHYLYKLLQEYKKVD